MKLKDKVIVITGSTRGIGRAIAKACAKEGARIVICSRHESAVKETCGTFTKQGFNVSGVTVDVSNQRDLEKLLHARAHKQKQRKCRTVSNILNLDYLSDP